MRTRAPYVVTICGSWRRGSLSRRVLDRAEHIAVGVHGVRCVGLQPEQIPHYDADVEAKGLPRAVHAARRVVADSAGLVIVTPEYNGATPGALQNLLDWLSRPWLDCPLTGKPVATISVSPGAGGGARAHRRLRDMLEVIGAEPVGPMVCIGDAEERCPADGARVGHPDVEVAVSQLVAGLVTAAVGPGLRGPCGDPMDVGRAAAVPAAACCDDEERRGSREEAL